MVQEEEKSKERTWTEVVIKTQVGKEQSSSGSLTG